MDRHGSKPTSAAVNCVDQSTDRAADHLKHKDRKDRKDHRKVFNLYNLNKLSRVWSSPQLPRDLAGLITIFAMNLAYFAVFAVMLHPCIVEFVSYAAC